MSALTTNLRKAAVFMRSLDSDTAASLLSQLTPAEAKAVRAAIQSLGQVEDEERADVAAEFRRSAPLATEDARSGVALEISNQVFPEPATANRTAKPNRPFEFLEQARVECLVPFLSREHAQTIAIVLSYLAPHRAAEVLAALPASLQCDAIERLSALGELDASSVQVVERELAEWMNRQQATRTREVRRNDAMSTILAAADDATRSRILAGLMQHNRKLAEQFTPPSPPSPERSQKVQLPPSQTPAVRQPEYVPPPKPRTTMPFEDLAKLEKANLLSLLRAIEPEILTLALAGASEALVERIAEQMPRATATEFRRRLRRLGPIRLRDVEAAQREVASVAAEIAQSRRSGFLTNTR